MSEEQNGRSVFITACLLTAIMLVGIAIFCVQVRPLVLHLTMAN